MEPVTVTICMGTACVVMDGSRLVLLEEHLPERLRGRVRIRGERCLELCTRHSAARAPFVLVDGEPLANATFEGIVARIEDVLAGRA
ncbi:NADH-quinone oxidoreductase subunit NuoE family protein [Mesoterricola silvestris]|uniref:(2Fe-2S) ferredoxin domain-containing protein n=1 Tax=Mesoterricola silvestris TaxID=2927979 RepID=A0AA48K6Z8_9BACT|nr:hypothetical protein [Mesoterricola silvestris]BDU71329.1 hypothetical protein METEAL_05030 [Mesoterricola silvestris]